MSGTTVDAIGGLTCRCGRERHAMIKYFQTILVTRGQPMLSQLANNHSTLNYQVSLKQLEVCSRRPCEGQCLMYMIYVRNNCATHKKEGAPSMASKQQTYTSRDTNAHD